MKFTLLKKVGLLTIVFTGWLSTSIAQLTGYTATVQSGVALDPGPFTNSLLTTTTTIDEGTSAVTNLPFTVTFGGIAYNQFSVSTNGFLRLGSVVTNASAANSLASASDNPKLAVYWDDLLINSSGGIFHRTTGTAPNRRFIVQFQLQVPKVGGSVCTSQIWFNEGSHIIQFVYGNHPINAGNYSIGVAASSTSYISYTASTGTFSTVSANNSNSAALSSGLALTFTPALSCPTTFFPANNSSGINGVTGTTLSWSNGGGATSFDVFFGTSTTPPLVSSSQTTLSYATGTLNDSTTYYWRIVPRNGANVNSGCVLNSFTTSSRLNYNVSRTTGINYTSISATGTSITSWKNGSSTDDNISNNVPIGFSFRYAGANYTNFQVGVNGIMILDSTNNFAGGGASNPYNYNTASFYNTGSNMSPLLLAPFYQDLVCQGNPGSASSLQSSIKYRLTGASPNRVLTVEWISMEIFGYVGPDLNFQVKLYESSNVIEFVYGTMESFNGTSNYIYNYSVGLTGRHVSNPVRTGELLGQLTDNTNNFGTVTNFLSRSAPDCNTQITFTPGTLIPFTAVLSIPANDNSTGAIPISVSTSPCLSLCNTYFSSANATSSGLSSCAATNADDDVWFSFTATTPATTVRILASNGYTPGVELFSTNLSRLNCASGGQGLSASISPTNLTVGTQYLVRVYDVNSGSGVSGKFSICVFESAPPPSNDNCSGAIPMPVTANITLTNGVQSLNATASAGIPVCNASGTQPDDDVWYSFNAGNTTQVITVQGASGFDPVIQLFSGGCAALTSISCVNSTGSAQTETLNATNLIRNQTYFFRVFHSAVGAGTGNFSLNVSSPIPSCPTTLLPATGTAAPVTGITLRWNRVPNANSYRVLIDSLANPPTSLFATTTDTFFVKPSVTAGFDYFWSIQPVNTSGNPSSCISSYFSGPPLTFGLNLKLYLEAFFNPNQTMNRALNPNDTLSDTISVSLMSATTKAELYSANAILSSNGFAAPAFPQPAVGQSVHIRVKHRNCLETWSPVYFWADPDSLYDFTNSAQKTLGGNAVQVATGVFAIYSGDVNQDGIINLSDLQQVDLAIPQFLSGYNKEDLNGDGVVESADYSFIENRLSIIRSVIRP